MNTDDRLRIDPEEVALHVCCSGQMTTIAENLREIWQKEDSIHGCNVTRDILVIEDTMSSNVYPWQSLVEAGLAKFCVVKQPYLLGAPDAAPSDVPDVSSSPKSHHL